MSGLFFRGLLVSLLVAGVWAALAGAVAFYKDRDYTDSFVAVMCALALAFAIGVVVTYHA